MPGTPYLHPLLSSIIGGDNPGLDMEGLEQLFTEAQLLSCALCLAGEPPGFRTSAAWPCWAGDTLGR